MKKFYLDQEYEDLCYAVIGAIIRFEGSVKDTDSLYRKNSSKTIVE